jgi:hypothetical protein
MTTIPQFAVEDYSPSVPNSTYYATPTERATDPVWNGLQYARCSGFGRIMYWIRHSRMSIGINDAALVVLLQCCVTSSVC